MLRTLAIIFGLILIAVGVLGFLPEYAPEGHLFGIFHVNLIHNLIHIATGVVAIICAANGYVASRYFFRVFGVIYAIVAALGFYYQEQPILGLIANNMADNWLHAAIALFSLIVGFSCCCDKTCAKK